MAEDKELQQMQDETASVCNADSAEFLPEDFGFMLAHPSATVAPAKLRSTVTHHNPPGISGWLVEGRFCYDAFVLENKTKAIYYQTLTAE